MKDTELIGITALCVAVLIFTGSLLVKISYDQGQKDAILGNIKFQQVTNRAGRVVWEQKH